MRTPDLPGYGALTDPPDLETRTCRGCGRNFTVDLNSPRYTRRECDDCEADARAEHAADLRVDRADARQAQIARNIERGA